jgi:maltose alpha-D-glucosyltransferase / alpha-amylase
LMRGLSDLDAEGDLGASLHEHFEDYEAIATLLGRRLGEMHALLAQPSDDPAFAPMTADPDRVRRWAEQVTNQLDAAYRAIDAQRQLEPPAAAEATYLRSMREPLLSAVRDAAQRGLGTELTRVHGDLHLGQTLVASGEIYIIDFEGEPARTLEERRAKASPLKDVAGVLRSFDYAAAMVQRKSRESHAHLPDSRRDGFLAAFIERAGAAFLGSYRAVAGTATDAASAALLDLFLIEKAAYEVVYESANRPGWLDVPLHGLARLADRLVGTVKQAADD